MAKVQKRYEYWGSENGKPVKKLTDWFPWNGPKDPWQLDRKLRNFYREV